MERFEVTEKVLSGAVLFLFVLHVTHLLYPRLLEIEALAEFVEIDEAAPGLVLTTTSPLVFWRLGGRCHLYSIKGVVL